MFNHWATGLRSGLLPQVVVLQHQKLTPKRDNFGRSFREGFDFWCQGKFFFGGFQQVLGGLPHVFYEG